MGKLYVGNLSFETTTRDLEKKFERYGKIVKANIAYDGDKKSKGFGFIVYDHEDDAKEARSKLNGTDIRGRKINVDWAKDSGADRDNLPNKPKRAENGNRKDRSASRSLEKIRDRDRSKSEASIPRRPVKPPPPRADRDRESARDRDRDRDPPRDRSRSRQDDRRDTDRGRGRDRSPEPRGRDRSPDRSPDQDRGRHKSSDREPEPKRKEPDRDRNKRNESHDRALADIDKLTSEADELRDDRKQLIQAVRKYLDAKSQVDQAEQDLKLLLGKLEDF